MVNWKWFLVYITFVERSAAVDVVYNDLVDLTQIESFVNLTSADFKTTESQQVDIKQLILDEITNSGQQLTADSVRFLNTPIPESGKFEGDIELPPGSNIGLMDSDYRKLSYAAIKDNRRLWPNGTVPYAVSSSYGAYGRMQIANAIRDLHNHTCLKFIPLTDQEDYIRIRPKLGCSSHVGRMGGGQDVSISAGCLGKSTIIHELMHVLGFFHEQVRYDRDSYVEIHWSNIVPNPKLVEQFQKQDASIITVLGEPYDQHSVMHYGANDFARLPNLTTISARDGGTLSNEYGMTEIDIAKLNKLYSCNHQQQTISSDTTIPQITTTHKNTTVPSVTAGGSTNLTGTHDFKINEGAPKFLRSIDVDGGSRQLRSRNDSGLYICTYRLVGTNARPSIQYIDADSFEMTTVVSLNNPNITSTICGYKCSNILTIVDFDVGHDSQIYLIITYHMAFPLARTKSSAVLVKLDRFGNIDKFIINPCLFDHDLSRIHSDQSLAVLNSGQVIITCNRSPLLKVFSSTLEYLRDISVGPTKGNIVYFSSMYTSGSQLVLFEKPSQLVYVFDVHNWELQKTAIRCDCYKVFVRPDAIVVGVERAYYPDRKINVFLPNGSIALSINITAEYAISFGSHLYALVVTSRYGKSIRKYELM